MGLWLLGTCSKNATVNNGQPNLPYRRQMSRLRYFKLAFPRNLAHFSDGLFGGLGLKLDPQLQPDVPGIDTVIRIASWLIMAEGGIGLSRNGRPEALLGLILFWVSPLWLYTLEPFLYPDMVFEWRSYLSVLGIGLMVSALPLYIGWPIVAIWGVQSWYRSHAFQSKEAYCRQALEENSLAKRQIHNLKLLEDARMAKEIAERMESGLPIPPALLNQHVRTKEFFPR